MIDGVYDERKVEPGGRDPAPAGLRTVQLFVNTRNVEAGYDLFDHPAVAGQWLFDKQLASSALCVRTQADLNRVVALREALRELLVINHDRAASISATSSPVPALVDAVAAAGKLTVRADDPDGVRVAVTAGGLAGALARLVLIVADASATGTWARLKVCSNDGCQWTFWDGSRNRRGRWCTMALCGNQSKVRAHRERAT